MFVHSYGTRQNKKQECRNWSLHNLQHGLTHQYCLKHEEGVVVFVPNSIYSTQNYRAKPSRVKITCPLFVHLIRYPIVTNSCQKHYCRDQSKARDCLMKVFITIRIDCFYSELVKCQGLEIIDCCKMEIHVVDR